MYGFGLTDRAVASVYPDADHAADAGTPRLTNSRINNGC